MKIILREATGIVSQFLIAVLPLRFIPFANIVLEQYFRHRMRKNDFNSVSSFCNFIADIKSNNDRIKKTAADYYCKISLENRPDPFVLDRLKTSYQNKICDSRMAVYKGDRKAANFFFKESLEKASVPVAAISKLVSSFNFITEYVSETGCEFSETGSESLEIFPYTGAPKKIILSGMYWSGTGALYDFFREFREVTALPGEQRLWKESDYSLFWGFENIDDIDDLEFKKYMERLFFIPLTGLAVPRTWQDVLAENVGINFIRNDFEGRFSASVNEYIRVIMQHRKQNTLGRDTFLKQSIIFTDQVLNALTFKRAPGIIMPDNTVHIAEIEAFKFFTNANLVCVFRDPRSNYAARYHENERFDKNPENFIRYYRETREKYSRDLAAFGKGSERIMEVQFEDFVLSGKYRAELAAKLGLDLSGWKKNRFFLQSKSEKNVYNYKKFKDQGIIRLISESLGEYCCE